MYGVASGEQKVHRTNRGKLQACVELFGISVRSIVQYQCIRKPVLVLKHLEDLDVGYGRACSDLLGTAGVRCSTTDTS